MHSPHHPEARLDMWRGMERLQADGVAKSIGVSNYGVHHLTELVESPDITVRLSRAVLSAQFGRTTEQLVHSFCQTDEITAGTTCAVSLTRGCLLRLFSLFPNLVSVLATESGTSSTLR